MGTSADAYLAFGIQLDEDDPGFERWDEDEEDDDAEPPEGPASILWKGEEEDGVEIIEHCSISHPMYFVAVASMTTRAHRGYPRRFDGEPGVAHPTTGARQKVERFVKKYGLKPADGAKIGWYLMSWWSQ